MLFWEYVILVSGLIAISHSICPDGQSGDVCISEFTVDPDEGLYDGDRLNITCIAYGYPAPSVRIMYPNSVNASMEPDDPADNRTVLAVSIDSVSSSANDGSYECEANNTNGVIRENITVTVLSTEAPPVINLFEDQEVNENDTVSIQCSVNEKPKPDYIRITAPDGMEHELNTTSMSVGESITATGSFKITINRKGNFTCSAGNEYGTSYAFADITIKDKDKGGENIAARIGLNVYLAMMMIAVGVWCS